MRPAAFLGLFTDIGVNAPDCSARFVAKLPLDDFRHLFSVLGIPNPAPAPEPDALYPGILIAPCHRPVHPETEAQVMAKAAAKVLLHLLRESPTVLSSAHLAEIRFAIRDRDWTQPRRIADLRADGAEP